MNDDFGIAVGLKNRALTLEAGAHLRCIDQVAIVRHGDRSLVRLHENRLRVQQRRVASCGVTRVANGERAPHLREHIFGEDIRH